MAPPIRPQTTANSHQANGRRHRTRTKTSSALIVRPAATGHQIDAARPGERSDQVAVMVRLSSSPSSFSHHGPCNAAAMKEATPKDSSTTIGQSTTLGSPTPEPVRMRGLSARIGPEVITNRAARANIR